MGADEEHDKGKMQQVIKNEVAADARGVVDVSAVAGKEVANVPELRDE
jgi:hypothetical protein